MHKEEVLQLWKEVVLDLRNNKTDRVELLKSELEKLNSCDADWLSSEYGKWFEKEVKPTIPPHLLELVNNQ